MTTKHITVYQSVSLVWARACEFEGIPTDSKFVVFSDTNKWAKLYNELMGQILAPKPVLDPYVGSLTEELDNEEFNEAVR